MIKRTSAKTAETQRAKGSLAQHRVHSTQESVQASHCTQSCLLSGFTNHKVPHGRL